MIMAGVAVVDITPPPGLLQAGFSVRTEPATGAHDPLTVRAIVVGDTAMVTVDVVGLNEDLTARVRARSGLPDGSVCIAATHTHGAPESTPGRLSRGSDPAFVQAIEDGCVEAIARARDAARPARIGFGWGADPDVARNRRHDGGLVDRAVPVLRFRDAEGGVFAVMVAYACHPVVLGADNRLMTADYPHYVRLALEEAHPGAVAVFFTACAGDANNGHHAHESWTRAANAERSFATAERLGRRIGEAALQAPEAPIGDGLAAVAAEVTMNLTRVEQEPLPVLAGGWRRELETAAPDAAIMLREQIAWAERFSNEPPGRWTGRVSVFDWGGVLIVGLCGEIFAETALMLREVCGDRPAFVLAYCHATPGYIPPASEFQHGGYEVEEAHRFIGMPGTFAPGSAEALAGAAQALIGVIGRRPAVP
jgi:hypothetical protein